MEATECGTNNLAAWYPTISSTAIIGFSAAAIVPRQRGRPDVTPSNFEEKYATGHGSLSHSYNITDVIENSLSHLQSV